MILFYLTIDIASCCFCALRSPMAESWRVQIPLLSSAGDLRIIPFGIDIKREFKKLRRQLQRKRHIKIELCVKLSLLRLLHVDHFVQKRRTALSLAWYEWFSCKGKEWKIYCCELALSSEPQIWKFHVVVWQTTSKHCNKKRGERTARLFFFTQPIKSLICDVVVDVAVVKS